MWGISAALLVLGYLNAVVVLAFMPAATGPHDAAAAIRPSRQAGATLGWAFDRIAMLMDEVELTRAAEARTASVAAAARAPRSDQPAPPEISATARLRRVVSAGRATGDGELVLGVPDALLELPAVSRRLARLDLLELGLVPLRAGPGRARRRSPSR